MNLSRRDFLKAAAVGAAGTFASTLGLPRALAQEGERPDRMLFLDRGYEAKMTGAHEPSICPFCSVGCGIGLYTGGEGSDEIVHVEGDPDNPINGCPDRRQTGNDTMGGALCSMAQHIYHITQRDLPGRPRKVLHRGAGGSSWETLSFDDALARVVEKIKNTRDRTFTTYDDDARRVNRCEGIGFIGGSVTNNEPNYAFSKLMRALGCVYVDNESRDSAMAAIKAMRETFGRPGMTNTIPDIKNASHVLIVGANPGADQPVVMRWVFEAQDSLRSAKVIVVDPRVSRTATKATMHVRIRPGTDLALICGMINHVLTDPEKPWHEDYVLNHTDATFILDKGFSTPYDPPRGVFSGYDKESRTYNRKTWKYRLRPPDKRGAVLPRQDTDIQQPQTVLNVLRKHFSKYKPAHVCYICGITVPQFNELCKTYATTGRKGEAGVILFGRGVMSQATGAQTVRALAILQLLLGNIGVAGGGLVPLLPSVNSQGACDMGLLAEYLPGYLEVPLATDRNLKSYLKRVTPVWKDPKSRNRWKDYNIFMVNLLRAFFGEDANRGNDWGFGLLPKRNPGTDYTLGGMFEAMEDGKLKGLIVVGENPAVGPNGSARRKALSKLDWLVVYDIFESETSNFWKSYEGKDSSTEVFLFPATTVAESSGSVTNMSRWVQWQRRPLSAIEGERKEAIHLAAGLIKGLKGAYGSGGQFPEPITSLAWDEAQTDPELMLYEIGGCSATKLDETIKHSSRLAADGSTRCGCWLYAGVAEKNIALRSEYSAVDGSGLGIYSKFAWSWPDNIRMMYNRASMDKEGRPYDDKRVLVNFVGNDLVKQAGTVDGDSKKGPGKLKAFVTTREGVAKFFAEGMRDGPFPEYYEPLESTMENWLERSQQNSPLLKERTIDELAGYGRPDAQKYPIVGLTYSLAEHHSCGQVTRRSRGARELIPEFFIEVGADLAAKKGITGGQKVTVRSARLPAGITGRAIVTQRLNAIRMLTQNLYMIAVPENFGFVGESPGAPAHDLTASSGDPNTGGAACRMFLCDIVKA